ncbi:hypothetical protein MtrunA17_Chr4g0006281 [Medicago truncatula]|uniref:Transmembrane protein n=1 Tax=Medicago truncatula TaxID=3880 RepID=A0A396HZQ2_MEDTR|nr:hypothetical protein MtrunA17_Chr4g0006281 [Medicago truncatula]
MEVVNCLFSKLNYFNQIRLSDIWFSLIISLKFLISHPMSLSLKFFITLICMFVGLIALSLFILFNNFFYLMF